MLCVVCVFFVEVPAEFGNCLFLEKSIMPFLETWKDVSILPISFPAVTQLTATNT